MAGWFNALKKTRDVFAGAMGQVFKGKGLDANRLEDLEEALMRADMNPRMVMDIMGEVEKAARRDPDSAQALLRSMLLERLDMPPSEPLMALSHGACVLLLGVNGAGKTTTTAKLARRAQDLGKTVILGAADTFRAAGTEQVRVWGERLGVSVVAGKQGSDASAVAYDALDAARARNVDLLFIDTAGRMHTKSHLMDELQKMIRALQKREEGAPQAVWMILDASIGQNALNQAKVFNQAVPLTGVIITKLDGSSKAGFLFSVREELPHVPVLFVGLGEQAEDLVVFEPEAFVDSLLGFEVDG